MLLFVTYQLWWSNVRAHQQAGSARNHLQEDWASGKRKPGAFSPGRVRHPAHSEAGCGRADREGVDKSKVLDRGDVGHYGEGSVKTAMPDAKTGNFGLAGHRNTHGGTVPVHQPAPAGRRDRGRTQDDYFVYKMTSILPGRVPKNTSVLDRYRGVGFHRPAATSH